jgi:hypothetical protein
MVSVADLPPSCTASSQINIDMDDMQRNWTFKQTKSKSRQARLPSSPSTASFDYWDGIDPEDSTSFSFVQDAAGHFSGSIVDLKEDKVMQFQSGADGSIIVTITASSDFAPEDDPLHDPNDMIDLGWVRTWGDKCLRYNNNNKSIYML